jgi:tetraacyldisaccharide 4'-kinase
MAPVPVICCGNAGVGGAGKTPLALDLAARLRARGVAVHFLTRGFGGTARAPLRVDLAAHDSAAAGDEALLLAAVAPCWVGADRAASARLAVAAGAQVLIMDDGLQNPGLRKTLSLLVVDGGVGFGNGFLLPAGPLREPVAAAASRCGAAVVIGADNAGAVDALPTGLPVLRASLRASRGADAIVGRKVVAFAGIGRPAKFFATLRDAGGVVVAERGFADHHRYTATELAALRTLATHERAVLVTTEKDFVRLPMAARDGMLALGVRLAWADETSIEALLRTAVP